MAADGAALTLLRERRIIMFGRRTQAKLLTEQLRPAETLIDAVKCREVTVDGKPLGGRMGGFALVVLTSERVLVARGGWFYLALTDIETIGDLDKGCFPVTTTPGPQWKFFGQTGVFHKNGNRKNSLRFLQAMRGTSGRM